MFFVALKPCRFGGTDYAIGERISGDSVLPEKVSALRQMGIIAIGFKEIVNQLNESVRGAMGDGTEEKHTDGENPVSEAQPPKKRGGRKSE